MNFKKLKGFRDVLPDESSTWRHVEETAARVMGLYGFEEVRLPLLEATNLFKRSIGDATDIVEKEMYTFEDTGQTSVTLRPEGTAPAVRAYVESGLAHTGARARWYYRGPMFRRERPQKGRFRQFHQIGAECFGHGNPAADADVIGLLWDFFSELGLIERTSLEINSLGCAADREKYKADLVEYLRPRAEGLCENCRKRIERNPLRVLDCKSHTCQELTADAPAIGMSLCGECAGHFGQVKKLLETREIRYKVNPRMVRGLDYYNRTTFELLTGELGAQNAVAAGGRYDGLVELLGGPSVPALGFAVGVERLVLMLGENHTPRPVPAAYIVYRGEEAFLEALRLRELLKKEGIRADVDFEQKSMKAQFRGADASGAKWAVVIAEEELANSTVTVKNLKTSGQESLPVQELLEKLRI